MVAAQDSPNTVDTIEDIIRILREKPEVREAVRREILTDELLELPEKVAQIITIQQQILERLDGHDERFDEIDRRLDGHDERFDGIDRRLDGIDGRLGNLESRTDSIETIQQKILETLDLHSKTLVEHAGSLQRIEENQRGFAAMHAAERNYPLIAMNMGLSEPRLLSIVEIAAMAMCEAASEYTPDELNSFRECDIIISAKNADGGECYVAVQVSTTADHGDIRRAIDHSKMVERFTGRPAHPAVAGFGSAGVAERRLASGSIHWHRLSARGMSPR